MKNNKDKSRRRWELKSFDFCHTCQKRVFNYSGSRDIWVSRYPSRLALCQDHYDEIYVNKELTLFDEMDDK